MKQMTFSSAGFDRYAKTTRREIFLQEMDAIVPWARLVKLIEPYYYADPAPDRPGRRATPLERMLRMYFVQHWFNLSDPAAEEALYDSLSLRNFVGVDLGREAAPDETSLCKFRHLIEEHALGKAIFEDVLAHLEARGVKVSTGTIVDATIIAAPSSTKNKDRARDPEMHQTKKGNQWHFGMKAHIGVDSKTKVIHAVCATAANVHDSVVIGDLLHGEETRVWGDRAYQGQRETILKHAPYAADFTHRRYRYKGRVDEAQKAKNTTKSKVRAKVEHPFGVIKRLFGFAKVRYRGLEKNANRLFVACALTNIFMIRRKLLRA
jgi:transposase, IS5 family